MRCLALSFCLDSSVTARLSSNPTRPSDPLTQITQLWRATELGCGPGRAYPPSLKRAAMVWWRTGAERARWLRVANPVSFVGTAVLNGLGGAGIIGRGVGQVRQYHTCVSRGRVALLVAAC